MREGPLQDPTFPETQAVSSLKKKEMEGKKEGGKGGSRGTEAQKGIKIWRAIRTAGS